MDLDPLRPGYRHRTSREGAPSLMAAAETMETKVDEIADGIYRMSTYTDQIPGGFTFNQYLVNADEPLMWHLGHRGFFPLVSEAVSRIVPVESVRWLSFAH